MRVKPKVIALLFAALICLALVPAPALAHDGEPPAPHDLWAAWNWEPGILLGLGLSAVAYGQGIRSLWSRAGRGRGVNLRQVTWFAAGWMVLFLALVSPLDALSSALFSAHMVQHVLLILLAAPLLVAGTPPAALAWAIPACWRLSLSAWWQGAGVRTLEKVFFHPGLVWALHAGVLWFWHVPGAYQAAVRNEMLHALEHASFLGTAFLFWWTVRRYYRQENGYGAAILYLFTTALQGGWLGSLITFSPAAWYTVHATDRWGLTALEDQQLAGVIMWVPAGIAYLGSALAILGTWLVKTERQDRIDQLPPVPEMTEKRARRGGQMHESNQA